MIISLLYEVSDTNLLKMKKHSLNTEIWKYFLLFSVIILGFLWVFQVLFLNEYYKFSKIMDIKKVAKVVSNNQNSRTFSDIVNNASFDYGVCVEVTDGYLNTLYSSSYLGKGCFSGKEKDIKYKFDFISSQKKNQTYELINPTFNNNTLVYAVKLNGARYAFINTSIEPIDSTINIIRRQLIVVSVVVLLLSFVIAYFISNYISSPIVNINDSAKKLAKGEFDTNFNSNSYILELEELAETLNYTKDELSKTEELRRDLMANVSHDLKTPLTMIKAYAEMGRDLHKDNELKREKDMNIIIEEVNRLSGLVDDITILSKLQSNTQNINFEEFNLVQLVIDILKRYEVYSELEDYRFIFKYNCDDVIIKADKKRIEQVIYNLVNNAINYTGDDNTININVLDNSDSIKVEIIDSGKGIKESDIPYIWDRYYKNKKEHKRNLIGTGLGLSIVKSILELHNYKYGVISEKDKGSNFYFVIEKEKTFK